MKVMQGLWTGPSMVAIVVLEITAQHTMNKKCFRFRRDIKMNTPLQWMESNHVSAAVGGGPSVSSCPFFHQLTRLFLLLTWW